VVHFFEVRELVDDEVVGKAVRQKDDFVVEVEVALAGGAPPAGASVFDGDFVVLDMHLLCPELHALLTECLRFLFVFEIACAGVVKEARVALCATRAHFCLLLFYPASMRSYKSARKKLWHTLWQHHNYLTGNTNLYSHTLRSCRLFYFVIKHINKFHNTIRLPQKLS